MKKINSFPYYMKSKFAVYKISNNDEVHLIRYQLEKGQMIDISYEFMKGEKAWVYINIMSEELEQCDYQAFDLAMIKASNQLKNISEFLIKKI